jgi:hypothetical protein
MVNVMRSEVRIEFKRIQGALINEFKEEIDKSISVEVYHHDESIDSFTGEPPDIVIYINEHLTDLIITGLLLPALYDGIKRAIRIIWQKIAKMWIAKKPRYEEYKNDIIINFRISSEKTIEFLLKGNLDPKSIESITEKLFSYLSQHSTLDKIDIPDFQVKNEKPRIRIRYNSDSESWEVVNQANLEKELKKKIDNWMNKLDS